MKTINTKNRIGRTVTMFIIAFVALPLYGQDNAVKDKSELAKFEVDFAEYRISQAGTDIVSDDSVAVHLFGFLTLPDAEKKKFSEQAQSGTEKIKLPPAFYLSSDLSVFRLYSFLRDGEIEYDGKSYTADAKGIVKLPSTVDVSRIKIPGKKTAKEDIAGSKHTPLSASCQYADRKIAVYDLGVKTAGDMN